MPTLDILRSTNENTSEAQIAWKISNSHPQRDVEEGVHNAYSGLPNMIDHKSPLSCLQNEPLPWGQAGCVESKLFPIYDTAVLGLPHRKPNTNKQMKESTTFHWRLSMNLFPFLLRLANHKSRQKMRSQKKPSFSIFFSILCVLVRCYSPCFWQDLEHLEQANHEANSL